MVLIYAVIYAIIYFIERYLKKDIEELQITRREMIVACIVTAIVYGISNLSYVDANSLFSGGTAMDIFIIRTLADLSGMACFMHIIPGEGDSAKIREGYPSEYYEHAVQQL